MNYQIGDEIIWTRSTDNPGSIRKGTITRIGSLYGERCLWVDKQHRPEDCILLGFAWPARCEAQLREILSTRQELKKQYDSSMSFIYNLRNRIHQGEI